ncbi:MAG: holin family protein [Gallionella sp.]|jgi:hypothetical protein
MGFDITGLGSIFDFGSKIIDKIFPDKTVAEQAKLEMFKLQQAGELQSIQNEFELMKKQIEVNAVEASSTSLFVSGWRPFVGWVCGFAFAYNYVFMPFIVWAVMCFKPDVPAMPTLDMGELTTLLFGMLGLGVMRTYEKKNQVAAK